MRITLAIPFVLAACAVDDSARTVDGTEDFRGQTAPGTVAWTGSEGLRVRAEPSTNAGSVGWLPLGANVTIVCQTTGTTVQGNDVWDQLAEPAGYVADAYVKTGHADFIPGVPICGPAQDGCGEIDWLGECDGDTLVWCEDDELRQVDCAAVQKACGWQDASIGNNCLGGGSVTELVVNGHELRAQESAWVEYVAEHVVPQLAGTRSQRLTTAARVAWWSLKEGVFSLEGALAYSNCNRPWGDEHIGPLVTCDANRAWQVGLSGSQVPWPAVDVEATTLALFPDHSLTGVLAATATEAGFAAGSSTHAGIVGSTGSLRRSWLLRNPAVGFSNQVHVVTGECIDQGLAWCYGTGWDESARYAPNRAAALGAIDDLVSIFDALAP